MDKPKPIEMKCLKCDYEWVTMSTRRFVSCPNCLRKVEKVDIKNETN